MKKVLVFLLICLSSTVMFAQDLHWTMVTTGVAGMNTSMTGVLYIDHEMHPNPEFLEIGVFDQNDVCRGAKLPKWNNNKQKWIYQLIIKGDNDFTYYFKIYDHESEQELDYVDDFGEVITWGPGKKYGSISDLYEINFHNPNASGYTLNITPYTGENDHYYLISSPVGEVNVDAVDNMMSNTYDLYYFDQANDPLEWINYNQGEGEVPAFTALAQGKGYLYANSGDETGDDVVLTFTGTAPEVPEGGYSIPLAYVEGARLAGHNLIGNPFAEEVGINKEFYIMNAEGTELEAAEREYLNPMEGAFVVATEPEQTVVLGGAGGGGFNPGGSFKVRVSGTRGGDHAIIRFGQGEGLPKFMINPEHTNISFPMEDADYAVAYAENMGEMPVNFKAEKNGSYTMDFSAKNVEFGYLHLIDNKNGNDVDLLANPTYSFDALTTDYATRFKLVFATGNTDDSFAFYSNGSFIISNDGNAMLQVVDVTGRILKSESINGCASVNVDAAPGVYMLRLINGDNLKVQKVVVK